MSVEADGSVRHEVLVDRSQEEAFWAFADLDSVKPRQHTVLAVPVRRTVLEQHAGGEVYDEGVDGSVCRWGRVLRFDPPHVIAFTWDIGPDWQVVSDLERTSEVEVTFTPVGPEQTSVTLVHRHLDRHGAGWQSLRESLDADDAWPLYLDRAASLARSGPRLDPRP